MFTATTFMAITMAAAALMAITMATAALMVVVVRAIGVTVIAITAATTTARASRHLLLHAVCHFFIGRSLALFNSKVKVLLYSSQKLVELLPSLKETTADIISNHILPQAVKLGNFFLRRGHTGHMLVTQLFTILVHLTEKFGSLGGLIQQTNTGISRNHFLRLSKSISQLSSQLYKFGGKRRIRHNTVMVTPLTEESNAISSQQEIKEKVQYCAFYVGICKRIVLECLYMRVADCTRTTGETDIALRLDLDGKGSATIQTGHAFFNHMLHLLSRHSLIDMELQVKGDLEVDAHHTIEDTGIALGETILKALGDKKGIRRYGCAYVPMDETLCRCVIDISNRPYLEFRAPQGAADAPNMPLSLTVEFCRALANNLRCNLHIEVFYGMDGHHIAEAVFKSLAHALRQAVEQDPRTAGSIPSTKGTL